MIKRNISQEFRSKNVDKTRNYFLEEIDQNELISNKHKKVCGLYNSKLYWTLSYFSLSSYWMYFNFCFCFLTWYSYKYYKLCNRIKKLCKKYRE